MLQIRNFDLCAMNYNSMTDTQILNDKNGGYIWEQIVIKSLYFLDTHWIAIGIDFKNEVERHGLADNVL